jgi:Flp pilus assembly protein TadG
VTAPRTRSRGAPDGGLVTTEFVLVMPLLIAFLFLLLAAGRMVDARSDVVSAANDAARVASLQTTADAAHAQAQLAAEDTLAGEGLSCQGGVRAVVTAPQGFVRGGVVQVDVACDVDTSDLGLLTDAIGAVVTVRETAREPIDTYRSE